MLVEVAASSNGGFSAAAPRAGGMLVPIEADFRGPCPPKKALGFAVVFCGDAVPLGHVVGVTVNTTTGNMCYRGQDLLGRAKRKLKK